MKTVSQAVADEVQNDVSKQQQPLTGLARRRKRSSQARALKDKIAAETVDFELMKGKKKKKKKKGDIFIIGR